jgi:Holliday junction resolvase RusA-like endonuclease
MTDENPFIVHEFIKGIDTPMIPFGKQVIIGNPPSKSNSYIIIILKNKDKSKQHGSLAKTKQLKQYENDFAMQCNLFRNKNIDCEFQIWVDVYFPSKRSDLDNCLKCLLDCLQQCKAIKNDNLCVKIVATKYIDPVNPRIEFLIKPI